MSLPKIKVDIWMIDRFVSQIQVDNVVLTKAEQAVLVHTFCTV